VVRAPFRASGAVLGFRIAAPSRGHLRTRANRPFRRKQVAN